jgi:4-aminobutyrate aminotransferase-like enzyme
MSTLSLSAHSTWKFYVPGSFGVHRTIVAVPAAARGDTTIPKSAGITPRTIRIKPPISLTLANADFLLEVLDAALAHV